MKTITLRPYQQRLLNYTKAHSQQKTYHFIAPPGSGKTILGLAILEALNKKTLILVPSLLLKEQWASDASTFLDLPISTTLSLPAVITVSTYQTAYQQLKDDPTFLCRHSIDFLILDEAHHLKKNWGDILLQLKKNTKNLVSLSLTATPPLDSNAQEWQTYLTLNGPIDDEISAAELVQHSVLNPYQDFVHFIPATQSETATYLAFLNQQNQIIDHLLTNEEVLEIISNHPFMTTPLTQTDAIYSNFERYISMLLFLNSNTIIFPSDHWKVLGFKKKNFLPMLSKDQVRSLYEWLWLNYPQLEIFTYLSSVHWMKDEQLALYPSFPDDKLVKYTQSKMTAIDKIILKEEMALGKKLCGVLLFERIFEEAFDFPENPSYYGVVPQFLHLQGLLQKDTEVGMICGRFALVSKKIFSTFFSDESDIEQIDVKNYFRLNLTGSNRSERIKKITNLLNEGHLNLLIGTVALLGEGWNCPNINMLILGNRSSSFVQTQQLRGRALRTTKNKVLSTIWHLGIYFPEVSWSEQPDLLPIKQRLSFIEGISNQQVPETITSGQQRFGFPTDTAIETLERYNQQNFFFAQQRELLVKNWHTALQKGTQSSMPLFIRPLVNPQLEQTVNSDLQVVRLSFWKALFKGAFPVYWQQQRSKKRWINTCNIRKLLAQALLETYQETQQIAKNSTIDITIDRCSFSVTLNGGTFQEEYFFNTSLMELLQPIQDTRYLFQLKKQFFAIPKELAKNKTSAEYFFKKIAQTQKNCKLIYTRNLLGRKQLVRARIAALQQQKIVITQEHLWH